MNAVVWYWTSTVILAVLLYFPVSKLIWVMRIRRQERLLGRQTTEEERRAELRSARINAALIALVFAFLYNRTMLSMF